MFFCWFLSASASGGRLGIESVGSARLIVTIGERFDVTGAEVVDAIASPQAALSICANMLGGVSNIEIVEVNNRESVFSYWSPQVIRSGLSRMYRVEDSIKCKERANLVVAAGGQTGRVRTFVLLPASG
jgi:hypothetical protein